MTRERKGRTRKKESRENTRNDRIIQRMESNFLYTPDASRRQEMPVEDWRRQLTYIHHESNQWEFQVEKREGGRRGRGETPSTRW